MVPGANMATIAAEESCGVGGGRGGKEGRRGGGEIPIDAKMQTRKGRAQTDRECFFFAFSECVLLVSLSLRLRLSVCLPPPRAW